MKSSPSSENDRLTWEWSSQQVCYGRLIDDFIWKWTRNLPVNGQKSYQDNTSWSHCYNSSSQWQHIAH